MDGKSRKRNGDGVPVSEEHLKGKEIMYQAQMEIQERKRQLNMSNNRPTPVMAMRAPPIASHTAKLNRAEASVFISREMSQREDRLKEIRAKLAASTALAALNKKAPSAGIQLKKESIPIEKEVPVEAPVEEEKPKIPEKFEFKPYLDPRLKVKGAAREKRATFNFHEKGEFESLANKQRQQARLENLQSKIADTAKSTGISSAVRLAMVTPAIQDTAAQEIPEVEWWDKIVLGDKDYDAIPSSSEPMSKRSSHRMRQTIRA
ncbi:hypothetical protein QR680_012365 [Steinernema hermaphroditum]|uniref:Pre-mRNA-splicing factor 3 domain-containing protein n=1 Tax=Steinernema hermaphroditum TaxID=289476 RepID=A0AA39I354_9BILA|nr:hypothetical protein QR680_012365 [Steinernema hermaphroditum]